MLKKHKNILFILTGIILLFFGYWYFVLSKKNTGMVEKNLSATTDSVKNGYDKEFVSNLQTVRNINLNTSILSTVAYKALSFPEKPFEVDYNIPVGRKNPFLPIGIDTETNNLVQGQTQIPPVNTVSVTASTTTPLPQPKKR